MLLSKLSAMAASYSANLAETGFASLKNITLEKTLALKAILKKFQPELVFTKLREDVVWVKNITLVMLALSLNFLLLKNFTSYLDLGLQNIPWIVSTLLVIMSLGMFDGLLSHSKRETECLGDIGKNEGR